MLLSKPKFVFHFLAKKTPFNIRFVSDHWEWSGTEAPKTPNGFKLIYTLKSC